MDKVSVVRDEDEPDPARRYKMICHWETVHVWDNHPTLSNLGRSDEYLWPDTLEMVFTPGAFEEYGLKYEHHGWTPFNYGDMDLCLLEYSVGGCPIAGVLGIHRDGEPWRRANGQPSVAPLKGQRGHIFVQMNAGRLYAVRV